MAAEPGHAGQALDLARDTGPERLPAERQARYDIDLAQAHAMRRQIGEPWAAWKKPNGSPLSRPGRTASREQLPVS